ncbi:hypothetical protein LJR219_001672 [Phenylobacterium sp. LjRoot219]|uniref:hypothetical protein n=1 Tax=Phenylobacterium sp. LjRoot219 TaxID=3342283 RepID=UPI003ECE6561
MKFQVVQMRDRKPGDELRVDVLGPRHDLIAAFASPVEAFRYAALIYQPSFVPKLRRAHDGATIEFKPHGGVAALESWLDAA